MGHGELTALADSYPPAAREELMDLDNGYQRRSEGEILELAALAADLSTHDIKTLGLEPEVDRQMAEALERLYRPNPIPEDLGELSDDQLEHLVHAVKGIYFEVLVRDLLNSGETLGELRLEPGQFARLAGSTVQEGWDLEIIDRNGETLGQPLQLKAVKDMQKIVDALKDHPKFRVVAAEAEGIDTLRDDVIGTGISQKGITEYTKMQLSEEELLSEGQFSEITEGAINNAVDVAAEFALDIIPLGSALIIVATEGSRLLMGRSTFKEARIRGGKRLIRPTAYGAAGTALTAASTGFVAVPLVMGARIAESRITGAIELGNNLVVRTGELNQLAVGRRGQSHHD